MSKAKHGCAQAAPDDWEAFWELSQARFELGDAAGGLLPLDRASALAPGNDEVALTLAEVRRVNCTADPAGVSGGHVQHEIWHPRLFPAASIL